MNQSLFSALIDVIDRIAKQLESLDYILRHHNTQEMAYLQQAIQTLQNEYWAAIADQAAEELKESNEN